MTVRLQRGSTPASCLISTGMPVQNAATIFKLLVPNPHSNRPTHGETCCCLGCTISPQSAFHSSILSLHLPPFPLRVRELRAIIIIINIVIVIIIIFSFNIFDNIFNYDVINIFLRYFYSFIDNFYFLEHYHASKALER